MYRCRNSHLVGGVRPSHIRSIYMCIVGRVRSQPFLGFVITGNVH